MLIYKHRIINFRKEIHMNNEGIKFILFLLGILIIPMIFYIIYIYIASDFYGKINNLINKKDSFFYKFLLLILFILFLLFGKLILNIFANYVLNLI